MATEETATRHQVVGWVRNLPSGQVEAVFEGERTQVEAMVQWIHQGPPGARVTQAQVSWEQPREDFIDFRIVY